MRKAHAAPAVRTPKRATPPALIPRRIIGPTLDDHLEIMTRAVFAAGLSWAIIAARWETFQGAFAGFAIRTVAGFGDADVERLMSTDKLIHSRKKITGTIANAQTLLGLEADFGSVGGYLATFTTYSQTFEDVRKRFAYVGDLSCYYWLFRTGNRVPVFDDWIATQQADHPRMREMVLAGRADGLSPEVAGF